MQLSFKNNITIALLLSVFVGFGISDANARTLQASDIYLMAKNGNIKGLWYYKRYIDIVNHNGDTAYCMALKQKDKNAAVFLTKAGANTHHKCVSSIPSANKTFLGMGKKGWLTTGAVVVAGGVAAAAGGGGGGGSGSSDNTNTPSVPSVPNCINGSLVNDKCVCNEGWKGNTCEQIVTCSYNTISCSNGYEETGNICKSGNITYKECKAKEVPTGYQQEKCGAGYDTKDTFLSGTTNYYKCEPKQVPSGYTTSQCTGGYEQEGETFVSGETNYYKCKAKDVPTGYTSETCGIGYDTKDTFLSGTTNYYKCEPKVVPGGYTTSQCTGGYEQEGETFVSGETNYYKCKAKDVPTGYTSETCGIGYDTKDTFLSGTTNYYKCEPKVVPGGYTTSQCTGGYEQDGEIFVSGETSYYKCKAKEVPTGYTSETCGAGYDTKDIFLSGTTNYYKCEPKQVPEGYVSTMCGNGYYAADTVYSGETPYYRCEPKVVPDGYTTTPCTGGYEQDGETFISGTTNYYKCKAKDVPAGYQQQTCGIGYDTKDTFLSGTTNYYKCEPKDCSSYQASCGIGYDAAQSCLSGTTPYYTCTPKQIPDGYTTTPCTGGYEQDGDTFVSGETNYYKCKEKEVPSGYTSETCGIGYDTKDTFLSGTTNYYKCEAKVVPDGYTPNECTGGYEQDGEIFVSGETSYYKCKAKTPPADYQQETCGIGYDTKDTFLSGTTNYYKCEAKVVPDGYTTTQCTGGYEQDGETFVSGEINYYKCKEKDVPAGYTSETCGAGYDTKDTFLSGTTNYYKCEPKVVPEGYTPTQCTGGYEQEGETFVSGITNYYRCKAKTCDGFEYANTCPTGYISTASCLSGEIMMYQCNACAEGYGRDGYGNCVVKAGDRIGKEGSNNGTIDLENTKYYADAYGVIGDGGVSNASGDTGNKIININNKNDGNVYGVYSRNLSASGDVINAYSYTSRRNSYINIVNDGDGNVSGLYTEFASSDYNNLSANAKGFHESVVGNINISNTGDGNIYGINAVNSLVHNASINAWDIGNTTYGGGTAKGSINISNIGSGNVYGILGSTVINAYSYNGTSTTTYDADATATISIRNLGTGNTYGIYAREIYNTFVQKSSVNSKAPSVIGIIEIMSNSGNAYGMYNDISTGEVRNENNKIPYYIKETSSTIKMLNIGDGSSTGIYSNGGTISNSGSIYISNQGTGTAIGIYAGNNTTVTNSGTITIDRANYTFGDDVYFADTEVGGTAIGIYAKSGSSVTNSGTITINKAATAYGIVAEDNSVTIHNTGTIFIDGDDWENYDAPNGKHIIVLNGATLLNAGPIFAQSLNLNSMGGEIVATSTSSFVVEDDISGDLSVSKDVVKLGFDTTYTVSDMIQAGDSSKLNLVSQSAMFDASLENGTDAVMTMKSFNDVLENQSFASFLEKNYNLKNNENFFSKIKSVEDVAYLNKALDQMFGKDMFSRFAFEDLMIMRELNFDINNKLFNNKEDYLSIGGNKSSFAFSGNSRYSLTSNTVGDYSVGLSVAFSDINSDDGNNKNQRYDRMYNISMPIGYQTNGWKFVSTPRVGYSYGTYDRNGFNNQTYEGTVEKQMFAFMNEVRYPLQIGGWNISPSAEFNFINYRISGYEKDKEYSLKIKSQNNYSVEAGIGLYASKETKFSKDSSLRFNGGAALYHEFADPYKMKLGMTGMSGTFTLRDEDRSDNRAVIQSKIEFKHNNFSIVGNVASYIDRKYETNATLDFKFGF